MPLYVGNERINNVSISFTIPGGYINTNDATLTSGTQMLQGITAYSKGTKVTGTLVVQNYYTGTTVPESSLGNDGDLYFKV